MVVKRLDSVVDSRFNNATEIFESLLICLFEVREILSPVDWSCRKVL